MHRGGEGVNLLPEKNADFFRCLERGISGKRRPRSSSPRKGAKSDEAAAAPPIKKTDIASSKKKKICGSEKGD